jgi:hypothetical protein
MKINLILNTYQCKKSCSNPSIGKQKWVSTFWKVLIIILHNYNGYSSLGYQSQPQGSTSTPMGFNKVLGVLV